MSFLDPLKGLFQKSVNTGIFSFFAPSDMPKMGEKEFLKAYQGWVYACVNAIAQPIAEADIKLERKTTDGWQPVDQNPALDILHNVNSFMSYYDLIYGTQAFIELHGNAFWYLVRNKGNKITEIWPLDPSRTQVVKSRTDFIDGYVFVSGTGEKIPFAVDEIVHFKTFNPLNPYRGIGTVAAASLAIDTDTYFHDERSEKRKHIKYTSKRLFLSSRAACEIVRMFRCQGMRCSAYLITNSGMATMREVYRRAYLSSATLCPGEDTAAANSHTAYAW